MAKENSRRFPLVIDIYLLEPQKGKQISKTMHIEVNVCKTTWLLPKKSYIVQSL